MRDKDRYMLREREGEQQCATRIEITISFTISPLRGADISVSTNLIC